MATIQTNATNRKQLVKDLATFLDTPSAYLGTPSYAYQVGCFTVNKDASITGDDLKDIVDFLKEGEYITQIPVEHQEDLEVMSISISLDGLTPAHLKNLIHILYTRQALICAMAKADFIVLNEKIITRLSEEETDVETIFQNELSIGRIKGVDLKDNILTMTFPFDEHNPIQWTCFADLMNAIIHRAKQVHHVVSQKIEPRESEMKYFCSNWLIQLGFGGKEHKLRRQTLLDHLHGFAAFKSIDKMDEHKAKQAYVREAKGGVTK